MDIYIVYIHIFIYIYIKLKSLLKAHKKHG